MMLMTITEVVVAKHYGNSSYNRNHISNNNDNNIN